MFEEQSYLGGVTGGYSGEMSGVTGDVSAYRGDEQGRGDSQGRGDDGGV